MKKKIICLLIVVLVFVTGCFNKVAITSEQFKSKMEANEYSVVDAKEQFKDYNYIKEAYIAASSDYSYIIEYYVLSNETTAKNFYNSYKSNFESTRKTGYIEVKTAVGNHESYSLKSGGKYSVVSRIDNTVVTANIIDTYESEVKAILKEIGY